MKRGRQLPPLKTCPCGERFRGYGDHCRECTLARKAELDKPAESLRDFRRRVIDPERRRE